MTKAENHSGQQVQAEANRLTNLEDHLRRDILMHQNADQAAQALLDEVDHLRTFSKQYNKMVVEQVKTNDLGDKNRVVPFLTLDNQGLAAIENPGQLQYAQLNALNQRHNYSPWEYNNNLAPSSIRNNSDAFAAAQYNWSHTKTGFKDQFTAVVSPRENAAMLGMSKGDSGSIGIGVELGVDKDSGYPKILQVIPRNQAEKAGLKPGDLITSIDGLDTKGLTPERIRSLLTGKEGTHVNLMVQRDGTEQQVDITREPITEPSVIVEKQPNGYARLIISDFMNQNNPADVANALRSNPDVKGWILDLRYNGGGYVDQAIDLASMFVKKGNLTTIRERIGSDPRDPLYTINQLGLTDSNLTNTVTRPGRTETQTYDRSPYLAAGKPVVILTNGETASAAEIFTSAVHDNHAATVIGQQTYGKAEGQTWNAHLPDGYGVKTTSLHYYTPGGQWLGDGNANRHGIVPDLIVTENAQPHYGTSQDSQFQAALDYLEKQAGSDH